MYVYYGFGRCTVINKKYIHIPTFDTYILYIIFHYYIIIIPHRPSKYIFFIENTFKVNNRILYSLCVTL